MLDVLLDDLLCHGRIYDACVVAAHFGHENKQLNIILVSSLSVHIIIIALNNQKVSPQAKTVYRMGLLCASSWQ